MAPAPGVIRTDAVTTEHQTAPDSPDPNALGSANLDEEGPLDPSMFFGLFDDLETADTTGASDTAVDSEPDTPDEPRSETEPEEPQREPSPLAEASPTVVAAPAADTVAGTDGQPPVDAVSPSFGTDTAEFAAAEVDADEASTGGDRTPDIPILEQTDDEQDLEGFLNTIIAEPASPEDEQSTPDAEPKPYGADGSYGDYVRPPLVTQKLVSKEPADELKPLLDPLDEPGPEQLSPPKFRLDELPPVNYELEQPVEPERRWSDESPLLEPRYRDQPLGPETGTGPQLEEQYPATRPEPYRRESTPEAKSDSSITITTIVMTIVASFGLGLMGLAAMFALTDDTTQTETAAESQDTSGTADSTVGEQAATPADQEAPATTPTSETNNDQPATGDTVSVLTDGAGSEGEINPLVDPVGAMAAAAESGRLDLLSLQFVPGTDVLTPDSAKLLDALVPRLSQIDAPVMATVRATGQPTAQANLALSQQQAVALTAVLVNSGMPEDQVRVVGLGAGPLSASLPVPDFVAATPELGDAVFSEAVAASGPFVIGSSPAASTFRVESATATVRLRQAMERFSDSTIGLAAYSFFAADNESARSAASGLADGVVSDLTAGDVSADRITVITPGAAPFVITPEVGGHIWLQAGAEAQDAFNVAGLDSTALTFETGTADLTAQAITVVDALSTIVNDTDLTLTIDVRTYSQESPEDNTILSQQQATEIRRRLVEVGGAEPGRVRAFGSGPSTYYPNDGRSTATLTVSP